MEINRPTFELVKSSQNKLRFDYFEKLIESNDIIDQGSREDFVNTLAYATLGLEVNYEFEVYVNSHTSYVLGNLATWLRKALSFEVTPDRCQIIFVKGKDYKISNKNMWKNLLECLYPAMAQALTVSLHASAELQTRESSSLGLKSKEKIKTQE